MHTMHAMPWSNPLLPNAVELVFLVSNSRVPVNLRHVLDYVIDVEYNGQDCNEVRHP